MHDTRSFWTICVAQKMFLLVFNTPTTNGFIFHRLHCEQEFCLSCRVLSFMYFFEWVPFSPAQTSHL